MALNAQGSCTARSARTLRSTVIDRADCGTEGLASLDGQAVAVGHYRGGELHPSRVLVR